MSRKSKLTAEQIKKYNANRRAKYRINPTPMKLSTNTCYRKRGGWTPEMYEEKKKEQKICVLYAKRPRLIKN